MVTKEHAQSVNVQSASQCSDEGGSKKPTPLPISRLLSVFLIQLAEPLTATVVYPFVNQLVRETGITGGDEEKTGYYAGVIESAFFFTECLTCVMWGYLSDRFGRRPILLCAPLGLTMSMLAFGSSTTFWPLVVSRCLQGIFNGNMGVAQSIIAEMTDSTNRGDAYAVMPILWNTGVTIGPIIGGVFSNPAEKWPNSFGRIVYIRIHPYFLPCFLAAIFSFVAFIVGFLTLEETLPSRRHQDKLSRIRNAISNDPEETPLIEDGSANVRYGQSAPILHPEPMTSSDCSANDTRHTIFTPLINRTLINLFFLTCLEMAHFVLLSLMYSTPVEYGGLGLGPFEIGMALGAFGFINSLFQAQFLGGFIRKYGARKVYISTFPGLLGCFCMFPILKSFAQRAHGVTYTVIAGIVIQFTFRSSVTMACSSLEVVLVESVPEGGPLGSVIGVAQMIGSGLRTIAPTFASSLFSLSIQENLAGGNLVYYLLMAMTLVGIWCSSYVPRNPPSRG